MIMAMKRRRRTTSSSREALNSTAPAHYLLKAKMPARASALGSSFLESDSINVGTKLVDRILEVKFSRSKMKTL
jgi:hypothetical protein